MRVNGKGCRQWWEDEAEEGRKERVKVGYRLLNVIYGNLNLCSIARWKSPN